eukprot:8913060-Lingulodinium_polyedra.AAC.1
MARFSSSGCARVSHPTSKRASVRRPVRATRGGLSSAAVAARALRGSAKAMLATGLFVLRLRRCFPHPKTARL